LLKSTDRKDSTKILVPVHPGRLASFCSWEKGGPERGAGPDMEAGPLDVKGGEDRQRVFI
jgi:hypothetical protein